MKRNIDLLHEPILPALTRLALPIMATSLVQMAYNLTDMAWIGLVGADAVAAVGSAGMYTWFSQGVSNLAKMGGQVKVAHALGRGSEKEAAEYAQGAIQIGILFAVLFGVITVAFRKGLVGFFGMQSPYIIREAEKEDRGFYTGIFGYFDGKSFRSAVMIRFIEQQGNRLRFRSGGGITVNSDCSAEYQEVLQKVYLPC